MMAHNQLLHELLKKDQEPFQLKNYIEQRQSHFKATAALQLTKRTNNLVRHACFFSFQNSPDVSKSPFPLSPLKSPCKSRKVPVSLHIPSKTAALLAQAAMRIQKQQHSKPEPTNLRFGMLGSFLKRLKDRSKNKKRSIRNDNLGPGVTNDREATSTVLSGCSQRRPSSADWTETCEYNKSLCFEASTSNYGSGSDESINGAFDFLETRFSSSPFRFSLHNDSRTPEFCSPVASPSRHVGKDTDKILQGEEEEEQCSPVSVLDRLFEDESLDHLEDDNDNDNDNDFDLDLECSSYANVQKAKEQLLHRLRRFEKLAELDPKEMEKMILEGSDGESDEPMLVRCKAEPFVPQIFNNSLAMPNGEEMIELELKGGWVKFAEEVEGTATELEVAIFAMLVEEELVLLY